MTNVWSQIQINSFDEMSGDNWIAAMVYFKDSLYVATARHCENYYEKPGGNIYRLDPFSCKPLINVNPDPGIPLTKEKENIRMAVYNNFLYVTTDNGLMRTPDGQPPWENVSTHGLNFTYIISIIEFKGYLYFLGKFVLYRTDGIQWESMPFKGEGTYESMQVFNGYLYVGLGKDDIHGFQVWRSRDGHDWSIFHEEAQTGPILDSNIGGHIHSMVEFDGHFYVGLYEGTYIGRTDGTPAPSPTHWERIPKTFPYDQFDVFRLEVHKDILYMGMFNYKPSNSAPPVLYQTQNGTDWNPVFESPQSNLHMVTSLQSHGENLYVGTNHMGDTGTLSLWIYCSEIMLDGKNNHSLIDAIPLELTKIIETSNELELENYFTLLESENFTLLKNETDYFDIYYQFQYKEWCEEVHFDNKIFHVDMASDYLSIEACTEFCRPMKLQIQDANGNVLGSTIGTGIQINCPSKTMKGQRVYLLISEPDGQPVRYNLTFAYVTGSGTITGEGMALKEWREKWPPEMEHRLSPILDKVSHPRINYRNASELLQDLERCTTRFLEYRDQIQKS